MYRLLPVLFMLALIPESEKKLENLHSFVLATRESVVSIRDGLNSFHASMMPFMMAQTGENPGQTRDSSSPGGGEK